jgi:hypothetical protein
MRILVNFLIVIFIVNGNSVFDLVKLNSSTALCLDGSPGAYYISRDGDPSKILLYFAGGGWCVGNNLASTIDSCY